MQTIVLLSGGIDSAVALYWARSRGWEINSLEFEYHERPNQERKACRALCARADIQNQIVVPLPFIREAADIPQSERLNPLLQNTPPGYIPLRNLIFYSLAGYHAEILGARYIIGGHNRSDYANFPDAGKGFWDQLNQILKTAIWSYAEIQTEICLPLIGMWKDEVVGLGAELQVPLELTWSCYFDGDRPCGSCPSCVERAEAFSAAGLLFE